MTYLVLELAAVPVSRQSSLIPEPKLLTVFFPLTGADPGPIVC